MNKNSMSCCAYLQGTGSCWIRMILSHGANSASIYVTDAGESATDVEGTVTCEIVAMRRCCALSFKLVLANYKLIKIKNLPQ
jgi:hypothetical protein